MAQEQGARVTATVAIGALVGCLVALLLIVPLIALVRHRGWDDFPDPGSTAGFVVFTLWLAWLGGRFGYRVATYDESNPGGSRTTGSWRGLGWSIDIARDWVDVSSAEGEQRFTGADIEFLVCRRQGNVWFLETRDGVLKLPGLDADGARAIQTALLNR